ncbi:MAG: 16S rRNA (adenine(1518)-N(6)/adenine(1519)-N(6))-dimethyltransferase RsmA [Bacillota bacterium]
MKKVIASTTTRDLLKQYNFKLSKSLGQNFLIDEEVLEKIITGSEVTKDDCVLEIGPGMGALTQKLCEAAGSVLAVELDKRLIPILSATFSGHENFRLINDDILKINLKETLKENFGEKPAKVVANLPYYITTPIIMKLLEERLNLKSITIMVQKEVGDRLKASPGGKDYGALSVAVQYYCRPMQITLVPPDSFIPQPEVESTVIRLDILEEPPVEVEDERLFFKAVKAAFGQRRKTLLNALSSGDLGIDKDKSRQMLEELGIDERRRGETLSLQEFANIANKLNKI